MWDYAPPRGYHRDRVYWRLVVELIARWEAGDLVVKARRLDDPTSEVEVVKLGLLRNPFMVLHPHHLAGGLFGPEEWQRRQPPTTLLSYFELTVWPAKAAVTKQKAPPRVPYSELLHWWTAEYLPQHPEPDKRPNVETQRTDAAAAFPEHAPPTERTMQNLRADKDTPPEWTESGRRPKSNERIKPGNRNRNLL
jgi:hypothetical protein